MKLTAFNAIDYIEGLAITYGPNVKFTANEVLMAELDGIRVAYVTFDQDGCTMVATVWYEAETDNLYGEW